MTKQEKQIEEGLRLEDFVNSLKINGKRFAKEVGVSQALVSSTLSGAKPITRIFVNKITSRYPELRESWIFSGEGPMCNGVDIVETSQFEPSQVRTLDDLEKDYKDDPLAGLRDLIQRVEELEKWKADWESRMSLNQDE
jgi:hypothetical protein